MRVCDGIALLVALVWLPIASCSQGALTQRNNASRVTNSLSVHTMHGYGTKGILSVLYSVAVAIGTGINPKIA